MKWKSSLTKSLLRAALLAGGLARVKGIPILTYHSIDREGGPTSVAPEIFERQMARLKSAGYESIPLRQLSDLGEVRRKVVLTFDDGYENLRTEAFPVLKRYGLTGTVFVASDYVGGKNKWETEPGVPRLKHLSWEQIGELNAYGIEIGAHTCSHPDLTKLGHKEAQAEIEDNKRRIEEFVGREVESFCYPYGAVNDSVRNLVDAAGFSFACTLDFGVGRPELDPLKLGRFGMNQVALREPQVAELYMLNCLKGSAPIYIAARKAFRRTKGAQSD